MHTFPKKLKYKTVGFINLAIECNLLFTTFTKYLRISQSLKVLYSFNNRCNPVSLNTMPKTVC